SGWPKTGSCAGRATSSAACRSPSPEAAADSAQTLRGSPDSHPWPVGDDLAMGTPPIVICYDGSPGAARATTGAPTLPGPRRAVVAAVAPPIPPAESVATISPVVPGAAFEQLNTAEASRVAVQGTELARASGFDAEARSALGAPTWEGVTSVA